MEFKYFYCRFFFFVFLRISTWIFIFLTRFPVTDKQPNTHKKRTKTSFGKLQLEFLRQCAVWCDDSIRLSAVDIQLNVLLVFAYVLIFFFFLHSIVSFFCISLHCTDSMNEEKWEKLVEHHWIHDGIASGN